MRSYDKYRSTRYIQKNDVEKGVLVTIDKVTEENKAPEYQAEDIGYVIHFKENFKPWGPNIGSLEQIKSITGTGDVDRWPGTVIVLYVNPDVEHKGKRVGGIRCRAPKAEYSKQAQINGSQTQEPEPPEYDDVPF